jgi:hypothetical protein
MITTDSNNVNLPSSGFISTSAIITKIVLWIVESWVTFLDMREVVRVTLVQVRMG